MSTGEPDGSRQNSRRRRHPGADKASGTSPRLTDDRRTPPSDMKEAGAEDEEPLATDTTDTLDTPATMSGTDVDRGEPFAEESFTARLRYLFASRRQRDGSAWTLSTVARATQGRLSLQQISKLYYGKSANPQLETVAVLAEVFGIEPDYFVRRGALAALKARDAATYAAIEADPQIAFVSRRMGSLSEADKALLVDVVRRLSEGVTDAASTSGGEAEMRRDLLLPPTADE